jgi:cytoskeletal protein CcmA (bactofilin family)
MRKRLMAVVLAVTGALIPGLALAYSVQTITIDGDINGDLICAGSTVNVNGAVHGDVICAGQLVSVNGPVDGSVRLAGQSVSVNNTVGRNATLAGQAITLGTAGHVSGDLGTWGQTVSLTGAVDKDVYGGMQTLSLGAASGPVDVKVQTLALSADAKVNGDLKYMSDQTFDVDKTKVIGAITRTAPPVNKTQRQAMSTTAGFAFRLYWIIATLVTALVLTWLVPRLFGRASRVLLERPWQSLGWGVLISIFGPFAFLLLLLSIIGIPLALLWLLTWLFVMGLGSMVAGVAVGRWLLHRADWHQDSLPLAALFGVPLVVILCSIPGVGGLVALVALSWAAGGLAQAAVASRA